MKSIKQQALEICNIYIQEDRPSFLNEALKRIKHKIEAIDEFKDFSEPFDFDGSHLCQISESQECGAVIQKWEVIQVIMNIPILKDNQKIVKYRHLDSFL